MDFFYESTRDLQHNHIELVKPSEIGAHFHAQIEILCVTKGCITTYVNGVGERIASGEICVIGSYDIHTYAPQDGDGVVILLPTEFLDRFFYDSKGKTITNRVIRDELIYSQFMSLLEIFEAHRNKSNSLFEEGFTNLLLGILFDSLKLVPGEGGRTDTVREIITYINEHYDEQLSLRFLSRKFGYSPYHFSRLFGSFTNVGLKQYIKSVKLRNALNKLKNGADVTEAALGSGYNCMRSFYRDFNEYYGTTPKRYMSEYALSNIKSRDK